MQKRHEITALRRSDKRGLTRTPGYNWHNSIEERDKRIAVEFAFGWEEEVAAMLDENGVAWQYKPRTFAVEWDEEGNFVDSFTPDFYLPAFDLFVEVSAADYRASGAKARKVRLLRQQHPEIRIEFRSVDRLARLLRTSVCPLFRAPG